MPFISCKLYLSIASHILYSIEKPGKTLHLLKASSKKINPNKKRLKIPLLGTITEFHTASKSKVDAKNKTNPLDLPNITITGETSG